MLKSVETLSIFETNALLKEVDDSRDKAIVTLFLCTGIFLNELIDLKLIDIDWDNRKLAVTGTRSRDIALNDQAYEALAKWSKDRPDTPIKNMFITVRGKVNKLSERNINKLIHKYADSAQLKKAVSANTLRNTFAVSLFNKGMNKEDVANLLGITDSKTIQRYERVSKQPDEKIISSEELETLEAIDTRNLGEKLVARILPTSPKATRELTGKPVNLDPETIIFGRTHQVQELTLALASGQSMLVTGSLGIGKTHLLKHLAHTLKPHTLYISTPAPIKSIFTQICDILTPDGEQELGTRAPLKDIIGYLETHKPKQSFVLVIDNLDKLKASDIDPFLFLIANFTILGAVETPKPTLRAVWWKFQQLALAPLSIDSSHELIKHLTQNMTIQDYKSMETKLMTVACGMPLAMVDMISQLSKHHRVKDNTLDTIYHEAGVTYRDWSSMVVIAWGAMIMFRFISLGTHNFEGYIFAGLGMSVLMMTKYFVFRMR